MPEIGLMQDSMGGYHFAVRKGDGGGGTKGTGNPTKKVNYGDQYTKVDGKKALKSDIEYTTKERIPLQN